MGTDANDGGVPALSGMGKPLEGWRSRGYLPHFEGDAVPQMVTFRLVDSLPRVMLERWHDEVVSTPNRTLDAKRRRYIETYLDRGMGSAWLHDARIARIVEDALLYFDAQRYHLHAWVIMPNHVHVLFTPCAGDNMAAIIQTWKSYTAHRANRILGRTGSFWQREYFDRCIRSEPHLRAAIDYIEANPVMAGLCVQADAWPFSSASADKAAFLESRAGGTPALPGMGRESRAGGTPALPGMGRESRAGGTPALPGMGRESRAGGTPALPGKSS